MKDRTIQKNFYRRKVWKTCRDSYMAQQGGLCERCLKRGLIVPADIVHHKIYLTEESYQDPSVALNFDNLEALCRDCHNKEHFKKETEKRWRVEDGRLIF